MPNAGVQTGRVVPTSANTTVNAITKTQSKPCPAEILSPISRIMSPIGAPESPGGGKTGQSRSVGSS